MQWKNIIIQYKIVPQSSIMSEDLKWKK